MGIADITDHFQAKAEGRIELIRVTMDYADGGKLQRFSFRVKHGGATNTIEMEVGAATDIDEMVGQAAAKAIAWAEKS